MLMGPLFHSCVNERGLQFSCESAHKEGLSISPGSHVSILSIKWKISKIFGTKRRINGTVSHYNGRSQLMPASLLNSPPVGDKCHCCIASSPVLDLLFSSFSIFWGCFLPGKLYCRLWEPGGLFWSVFHHNLFKKETINSKKKRGKQRFKLLFEPEFKRI